MSQYILKIGLKMLADNEKGFRPVIVDAGDDENEPVVQYFDEDGNDVTPVPFNIPDNFEEIQVIFIVASGNITDIFRKGQTLT